MKKMICKAKYLFATGVLMVVNNANVMAQNISKLNSGLQNATNDIKSIFTTVSDLTLIISALVGLVGGIQVYSKFSSGDPDGGKRIGKWVGGAVFIGLVPSIIRALFING